MENNQEIDALVKLRFEQLDELPAASWDTPSDRVWEGVSANITKPVAPTAKWIFWGVTAIVSLLSLLALYMMAPKSTQAISPAIVTPPKVEEKMLPSLTDEQRITPAKQVGEEAVDGVIAAPIKGTKFEKAPATKAPKEEKIRIEEELPQQVPAQPRNNLERIRGKQE
jgi:hypothetical protein